MLQIVNHGGHCCGVKHVFGFTYRPEDQTPALMVATVEHGASAEMKPGARFSPGPYPQEPGGERLDKLLAYFDAQKTSREYGHLLEAVLANSQKANWHEFLLERGFNLVTPNGFKNSNTNARLYVYHRITPLSPEMKAKKDERDAEAAKKLAATEKEKPEKKAAPLRARPPRVQDCGDPTCRMCHPRSL